MQTPRVIKLELIAYEETEGDGTHENPYRTVKCYGSLDGKLLLRIDDNASLDEKTTNELAIWNMVKELESLNLTPNQSKE